MPSSIQFPKKTNQSGFTLIEMAVVLVIVGIIISIVSSVLPSLIQSSKLKHARAVLEKDNYTMEGYIVAAGHCPCPDTDADGLGNRNDGGTAGDPGDDTCAAYVGNLPYRTLGLSSGEDTWHNSVRYGVYEDLIKTTTSNLCTSLSSLATAATDTDKLHIVDAGANNVNQAFALISGGSQDRDGVNGLFDGKNGASPVVQSEAPDKIVDTAYDDLVTSVSFSFLYGKYCTGGGGGGSGTTETCDNSIDDDGDGYIDCDDQDCDGHAACASGGTDVEITTASIPSGVVNSAYLVTFQATGGTTPYEWTLTDSGGFAGLSQNTYTGQLSGTLDQCPGTYTIDTQVTDSTPGGSGGPKTDSESFSLLVTSNLSVSRTSGSGSDITWSSASQQETFATSGGHLGDINWSLNTGGATGFTVESTGTTTAAIKKTGTTTAGTYTFTLPATDASCAGNTAVIVLNVTVTAGGTGSPLENLVGFWEMNESSGSTASDSSDETNHGTLYDFPGDDSQWVSGKISGGLYFDGSNDYVDCGNDISLNFDSTDTFSIAAWIKTSDENGVIVAKTEAGLFDPGFEFKIMDDKLQMVLITRYNGDKYAQVRETATGTVTDDTWHHVAITNSGSGSASGIKLYIDGSAVTQETVMDSLAGSIQASSVSLRIGMREDSAYPFNGAIDDLRFYDRELNAAEVADLADV